MRAASESNSRCRRSRSSRRCASRRCISAIRSPRCDQPADLLRAEVFRQAGVDRASRQRRRAAVSSSFGLAGAARGRLGLLPGRAAAGVQGRQLLQGRQFLLGRLQPARDRPAAARQLRVQRVAVGLGLLNLQLEHAELFLAGVELLGVRPFEHHLCRRRGAAAGQAQHGQRPADRAGDEAGMNRPASTQHDADDEHRAQAHQHAHRQHLAVDQTAGFAPPVRPGSGPVGRAARRAARGGGTARPARPPDPSRPPGRFWPRAASADSICSVERLRRFAGRRPRPVALLPIAGGLAQQLGGRPQRRERFGRKRRQHGRLATSSPTARARRPIPPPTRPISPCSSPIWPCNWAIHGSCSLRASIRAACRHRASLTASAANSRLASSRRSAEMVETLLMFLDAGVDGVEPFDGALGHGLQRPQAPIVGRPAPPAAPSGRAGQWPGPSRGPSARPGWPPPPAA